MQGNSYPSVDWGATALVNGIRYLWASFLCGVLYFTLGINQPAEERLEMAVSGAIAFGSLYGVNLLLLLTLRWRYDKFYQKVVNLLQDGMKYGANFFRDTSSDNLVEVGVKWFIGLLILSLCLAFIFGLLLMRAAASASDPILYLLKRTGLFSWLPDDYPLFSWSFYFLILNEK